MCVCVAVGPQHSARVAHRLAALWRGAKGRQRDHGTDGPRMCCHDSVISCAQVSHLGCSSPSLFLRFCLISESDVPIYHPVAFYEQVGPWLGVKAGEAGSRVPAPPQLL